MFIGARIRKLRQEKGLSQGDIEARTGLLRCYISRVEHDHTVPSLETMERFAAGLDIPLYQLFYEGNDVLKPPKQTRKSSVWGASTKEARLLRQFRTLLSRTGENDRRLLLHMARKMADHKNL